MSRAFVALGSNIDPDARLLQAARLLREQFPDVRFSRCFRNRAVGFIGDDFVNAVAGFSCALPVPELLARLHRIEERCGRAREAPKYEPRAMDLDLLLYGDQVGEGPGYTLPRRDLLRRPYMLGPLAEIAPELAHPVAGRTFGELWAAYPRHEHELVGTSLDLNAA